MESAPTKIFPIFGQFGGSKRPKMVNETAKHISNPPPSNETLYHSTGKVFFDHVP